MKKLQHLIILLIYILVFVTPTYAYGSDSYTDKFENIISNDIVSYNGLQTTQKNKVYILQGSNITYNIGNVKYVTVTSLSPQSTSVFSSGNKLYLTPPKKAPSTPLQDCFVYLLGNKKYAKDKSGNTYEYKQDPEIMFPKTYYFEKIDKDINFDRYFGINVYSINNKGEKSPLKLINNETKVIKNSNSVKQYFNNQTFCCPAKNTKIIVECSSSLGMEVEQITLQGENIILGEKPTEPTQPEKPIEVPDNNNSNSDKTHNNNNNSSYNDDYEILSDSYDDIEEPDFSKESLVDKDGVRYKYDEEDGWVIIGYSVTTIETTEKTTSKEKSSSKKTKKNKTKGATSNKETKNEVTENKVIINYETDKSSSSSNSPELEKIIAFTSIGCSALIALKIAASGFFKLKK